jgi:hypothetical protein
VIGVNLNHTSLLFTKLPQRGLEVPPVLNVAFAQEYMVDGVQLLADTTGIVMAPHGASFTGAWAKEK